MRLALLALPMLVLAACDNAPAGHEPNGPIRTDDGSATAPGQVNSAEAGELPSEETGPRFVGRWAADEKSCQSNAWQFTSSTLHTPAGSQCSFNRISEVPGGYDIEATCSAEAPPTSDTLKIRFAESAKAMLFKSKTIADSGLVFCGRDV